MRKKVPANALLAPSAARAHLDAVEAVEQFPEMVGNIIVRVEGRQGAQKALRCLGAHLASYVVGEAFGSFASLAGHHLKILCRFRNSSSKGMVPPSRHRGKQSQRLR